MKNIHFPKKTVLVWFILFISMIIVSTMVYLLITYKRSFPRVDKPDDRYSGYLRYEDVDAYSRTEIEFKSGKNVLKGYIYGERNTKGLIVISHGLGLGAESYLGETLFFVDGGWCVFAFDNTGTHCSEGKSTIGPSQSLLDLKAALTYISKNPSLNTLSLMLYGHSWGSYAVTAVLDDDFDIAAITSIAGFNSPMELLQEQSHTLLGMVSPLAYPFLWVYQNMLFGKMMGRTALQGINSNKTPILIIHGEEDEAISYYGASIIAHKDEITNPNVTYYTSSAKNHNGHSDLVRSDAAIEYVKHKNLEYRELFEKYKGEIPDYRKQQYYEGIDRFQVSELDTDFMKMISLFFEKQLP